MSIQVLNKQLDESQHCPLCQASMYYIDAEQFEREFNFFPTITTPSVVYKVRYINSNKIENIYSLARANRVKEMEDLVIKVGYDPKDVKATE